MPRKIERGIDAIKMVPLPFIVPKIAATFGTVDRGQKVSSGRQQDD